jgi:hypothetical protein
VKSPGEPDARNPHVRFDEREEETERWPMAPSYRASPRPYQRRTGRKAGHGGYSAVPPRSQWWARRSWRRGSIDASGPPWPTLETARLDLKARSDRSHRRVIFAASNPTTLFSDQSHGWRRGLADGEPAWQDRAQPG